MLPGCLQTHHAPFCCCVKLPASRPPLFEGGSVSVLILLSCCCFPNLPLYNGREIYIRRLNLNRFDRVYRKVDNFVVHPQAIKFGRLGTGLFETESTFPFQFDRIEWNNTFQTGSLEIKHFTMAPDTSPFTWNLGPELQAVIVSAASAAKVTFFI